MPHYDTVAPRFKAWETPPDFFKKLNEEFRFTLDAAASHENHLYKTYCTPEGVFSQHAGYPSKIEDGINRDGLTFSWADYRVFCNPPYNSSISKWVDKAFQFEAELAVLLLPPSFETAWGQRIWSGARESLIRWTIEDGVWPGKSIEMRLPPGRLRFWRPAFKNPKSKLKDYEVYGESIFDYSKPHVQGESPRAGNLIAIFRR